MSAKAWKDELDVIVKIIEAWNADTRANTTITPSPQIDSIRMGEDALPEHGLRKTLEGFLNSRKPQGWHDVPGYLSGAPVAAGESVQYPLAAFALCVVDDTLQITVRVFALSDGADGGVRAHGWRFESPDRNVGDRAHGFPHVQYVSGWRRKGERFLAGASGASSNNIDSALCRDHNENRPAFPLPSRTAVGVLIAALVAFYSGTRTREILENVTGTDRVRRELSLILDP